MGIIDSIKRATSWLGTRRAERTELEYLRTVYQQANSSIRPRQWYRISNENGDVVGFSFCCACGTEYQLLNVFDWLGRAHACPQCQTPFDVLKDSGINPEKLGPSRWWEKLSALPLRPRMATARESRFKDTWNDGSDSEVQWVGSMGR
jgi:hypothetical protein